MNDIATRNCICTKTLIVPPGKPHQKLGIPKKYTEGYYTSECTQIADSLGKLLTAKTHRITYTNRNRYRGNIRLLVSV
ncbi:MAG: hypothetical protein PUP91_12495 [Rhizonema sp. PD37]|nr:hypothetical protein [Rhizonema sp. PD37]